MGNKTPTRETKSKGQIESFETFGKPTSFSLGNLKINEPWCFNGGLGIRKYRITVEPIEESPDILEQRVRRLWSKCKNHHHWQVLQSEAKRLGFELDFKDLPK